MGELAEIVGGGTPDTNNPAYWDGDIDWYSPAELGEQIYADASQRKITREGYKNSSAKMLPADKTILFTSRAGIGTTAILRRSACTNQGFQSLVLGDEVNVYFLYSTSGHIKAYAESKASGSTFLEISGKQLAEMELMLPDRGEQDAIGGFFASLDNLITLHQRKYDQLAVLKKALLDKMFPRDGSAVPEVRFAGFTDPWEQRKLGELTKEIRRVEPDSDAPVMMISTPADGFIYQSQHYAFDNTGESLKKYICLHKGEMAYNHGASRLRPYGSSFVLKEEQARVPFVYHCYEVLDDDPDFISLQLNLDSMQLQLRKLISSGARMDGLLNISYEEYMSLVLLVPDVEEQRRISRLLASLNNLITLHQRKRTKRRYCGSLLGNSVSWEKWARLTVALLERQKKTLAMATLVSSLTRTSSITLSRIRQG